jgi:hypothetical protein
MKIYEDEAALKKLRVEAMKDVAAAYYSSKPQTVSYLNVIK